MKKAAFLLLIALNPSAYASPPVIYGYLSNFDVYNDTGSDKSGFEVDVEGSHLSDLSSTYCGSAFGCGTGYNTGSNSGLAVVYDGKGAIVAKGGKTHFGIHLGYNPTGAIQYDWLLRSSVDGLLHHTDSAGTLAAGQVPVPPPPPPAPPIPPVVLTPHWTFNNSTGRWDISITNTMGKDIWVQFGGTTSATAVGINQLLSSDPLITGTTNDKYELLTAGGSITESEDIQGATVAGIAKFFTYEYTGPKDDTGNAYCTMWTGLCTYIDGSGVSHTIDAASTHAGRSLGNMMTAANFSATVPVPAAAWLFGSGLLGLIGIARRRQLA